MKVWEHLKQLWKCLSVTCVLKTFLDLLNAFITQQNNKKYFLLSSWMSWTLGLAVNYNISHKNKDFKGKLWKAKNANWACKWTSLVFFSYIPVRHLFHPKKCIPHNKRVLHTHPWYWFQHTDHDFIGNNPTDFIGGISKHDIPLKKRPNQCSKEE